MGAQPSELTTVGDDLAVVHEGFAVHRFTDLTPGTEYELGGHRLRTLDRPGGDLLSRIATVNDLHFGEVECGRIDDHPDGPILRPDPGAPPYPEVMNRSAVEEIRAIEPDAVVVKGDLTTAGTLDEFHAFDQFWLRPFGERLHVVRGNHDAYEGQTVYSGDQWLPLPGVAVALVDTTIPFASTGSLSSEQLDWLDANAAASDVPVLVMGHHQQWISGARNDTYFGLHPDASDALAAVISRRRSIVAYTAGHTHRHRVRSTTDGVPSVEIGCVKDFPGTWAEYRVFEGGILQVVHRISSPEALAWSEQCRWLYRDFGVDYQSYALGPLEQRCFPIDLR